MNRESLVNEGTKLHKMLSESKDNLYKSNVAYERACRDAEEMKLSLKDKDKKKSEQKDQFAREKEIEYKSAIKNTNYFVDKMYTESMPDIMRSFQKMEEKRIDVIKDNLSGFLTALHKVPTQLAVCYNNMRTSVTAINKAGDIQAFIASNVTGESRGSPAVFQEYRADAVPVEKQSKLIATIKGKTANFLRRDKGVSGADDDDDVAAAAAAAAQRPASVPSPGAAAAGKKKGKVFGCSLAEVMAHQVS